jgi:phosphotriesterase-related protein
VTDYAAIQAELADFRAAGGTTLIDCQPGGCGRDTRVLRRLAEGTGLQITATTGYHLQKYYPADHWLWSASEEEAAAHFVEELTGGTVESGGTVRAATIKVAYDGVIAGQSRVLLEAAARAARQTGAAILAHTEQGRNVEALLAFFAGRRVPPDRLYLCHLDKRPDLGLHRELAQAGVLLGYDTFLRPRYDPERGVWPLLRALVADGLEGAIAIGLDLAPVEMWRFAGGPGPLALPEQIIPRLRAEGLGEQAILRLTAQNVAERLAWQVPLPDTDRAKTAADARPARRF